jgi:P pilus assembly chaperone PapD
MVSKKNHKRRWLLMAILVIFLIPASALAQRGISIAPTRVMLDDNERTATVYLNNRGNEKATFRIEIVNRRMLENGQIVAATTAGSDESFAQDFIRYSPRQVVVDPNSSQAVRLVVRFPADAEIPTGEYRSHLLFRSVPNLPEPGQATSPDVIGVRAMAIIETTIPIIVRKGAPAAEIRFGQPEFRKQAEDPAIRVMELPLMRSGERSVYGDLKVIYQPTSGDEEELLSMKGLAVYAPTPHRVLSLPLAIPPDQTGGNLRVTYAESPAGKGDLVAETVVPLP